MQPPACGATCRRLRQRRTNPRIFFTSASTGARQRGGALRAIDQNRIDKGRIRHQPLHFRANRPEGRDREVDQRLLEGGKLVAGELAQRCREGIVSQCGIDAEQVGCFRPAFQPFDIARQGMGVGFRAAELLGDCIGIIGQVDAREIGWIGLRHLPGTVLERHDPRGGAGDERLRQREETVLVAQIPDRSRQSRH